MEPSVDTAATPAKGSFGSKSAPLMPGEELRALISERRLEGRPAWRLGPYIAPRIEFVAVRDTTTGEPTLYRPLGLNPDPRPYFRVRVFRWLESRDPDLYAELGVTDRAELRRLAAAIGRDLYGRSYSQIADELRYDERRVRREIPAGRKLWPRLLAWPWCYWGPDGVPPREWRERGGDATLAAAFKTWATGEPVLAAAWTGLADPGG
jgi:hypothetical protein